MTLFKVFITLFVGLISCQSQAQFKAILNAQHHLKLIEIPINNYRVVIDNKGNVDHFYSTEEEVNITYYDDEFFDKEKWMKIKKIGKDLVEYWDINATNNKDFGKIKAIGNIKFEYYNEFSEESSGKLKSIGNIKITYYTEDFVDNSKFGFIKSIDNYPLEYGPKITFENTSLKKLTRFGPVFLKYFDDKTFDKQKFGNLKSIKGNSKEISVILMPSL